MKPVLNIKDEITVDNTNEILLRGRRITIPVNLETKIVTLAHNGHQGLAKTKALVREYAWFPNIDKAIKKEIENSISCHLK